MSTALGAALNYVSTLNERNELQRKLNQLSDLLQACVNDDKPRRVFHCYSNVVIVELDTCSGLVDISIEDLEG